MGIFDRLFQKVEKYQEPTDIRFGRYSDAYKESTQYKLWDESLALFEEKKYLDAYERFLQYLNDPDEDNITIDRSDSRLAFDIIQGSKKLSGHSDGKKLRVETNIAKINKSTEPLLLYLLEYNYQLRYCRFGLTADNHIAVIFDTTTLDGSPYKLYYALKEAASHADRVDDLLIHDYENIEHTDEALFHHISDYRKSAKYDYLMAEISRTLDLVKHKGNKEEKDNNGGKVYTLLSLAYRLDYLIKPEGYLMGKLEEINSIYFSNEITDIGDKIDKIIYEYESVLEHDRETLCSEMYWTKSTFGITASVNHDRVANFIEGELANMDWYLDNEHPDMAKYIAEYIVGYVLFHFAPPEPVRELLQLYWRVTEHSYFKELGFTIPYIEADGKYDRSLVREAIEDIVDRHEDSYTNFSPDQSMLRFGSRAGFAQSYLRMIQKLNMAKLR